VGRPEGKRSLGRPPCTDGRIILRQIYLLQLGWGHTDWTDFAQDKKRHRIM
jgi:hypothetical protein